ncbi:MAG: zinc metallopeptidase [bacterium]
MNIDYLTIVLVIIITALIYYLFSRYLYNQLLKVRNARSVDGREISSQIISGEGLTFTLQDSHKDYQSYIDISKNKLILSHKIINNPSVTSLAIVANELSYGVMYSKMSLLWLISQITDALILLLSSISILLVFLSLILNDALIYNLGLTLFLISFLFVLSTFPIGILNSIHSKNLLYKYSLISKRENTSLNLLLIFLSLAHLNLLVSLVVIVIDYILESLDIKIK